MAGHCKECQEAKEVARELCLLVEKNEDQLNQSLSSLKNRVEYLLVDKQLSESDFIALCVEMELPKKFLAAKYTEVERLRATVRAKSDYVALLKGHMVQQKTSIEKTKAA